MTESSLTSASAARQPRAYGVAAPDQLAGLSGLEILQRIVDGRLPQAPIFAALDLYLAEVGDGVAVFEGRPAATQFNPLGTVHGGWALTLIDSAAGCAGHSLLPPDTGYTTVETKANFSRPILPGTGLVRCEGRVIVRGRTIMSCEATVRGPDGKVLAHGTSTLMVLNRR
jgi:uncharacterized protein (TIGR00369 family)